MSTNMNGENDLKYIDNSLSLFIFNKVDSLRETDLINLCKSFYDLNEIKTAKDIIYVSYNKMDKKITRKGINKLTLYLQDIVKLIRTT